MIGKIKTILINSLLVLLSFVCLYLLTEWAFVRFYTVFFTLDTVPQKFENPQGVMPVMQTSKKGFLPRSYIAITGDSYAMGMGDGFYAATDRKNLRVTSAHTIQDLTGRDVISYGIAGSGNIRGMLANPIVGATYIKNMVDNDLADPEWLLLYFYEGNDLAENILFHRETFDKFYPGEDFNNPAIFENYVDTIVIGRDHLYLAATQHKPAERLFFYRYLYRLYIQNIKNKKFFVRKYPGELKLPYLPQEVWEARLVENPVNKAIINNKIVQLADNMQGPALDLTDQELNLSISLYAQALDLAGKRFKNTRLAVIYIPSVLATYQIAGDKVHSQDYFGRHNQLHNPQAVDTRSRLIRNRIEQIAKTEDVVFIDTTTELQQAALHEAIHGPNDWNHLNAHGYQALGAAIVHGLAPHLETAP